MFRTTRSARTTRTSRSAALTLAGGVAAGALLVGCSPESLVEKAVEGGIEAGTGVEVDSDDGSFSVEGDDGAMSVEEDGSFSIEGADGESMVGGAGSLPEGFPEDEVPLLDLEIVMGMQTSSDGEEAWSVNMESPDSTQETLDAATALLTDAGFTMEQDNVMGSGEELVGGRLFSGPWSVNLTVIGAAGDPTVVGYTVFPPGE